MSTTAICIGGPKDGEVVSALYGHRFKMMSLPDPGQPWRSAPPEPSDYRLEQLTLGGDVGAVWVHTSLTGEEAALTVLDAYRQARRNGL